MTLVLEIEHLTGVAFAALGPDSDLPDWPPQPDRVFSALVASWGARGQRATEARALEWLEVQPAPRIVASGHIARTAPVRFVPPNDPKSGTAGNPAVVPALRSRQPRRFPAARPFDPLVRYVWPGADPDAGTMAALEGLAADTAYVGHSTSQTRCRFTRAGAEALPEDALWPTRSVYKGRLAELCRFFDAGRRPNRGALVKPPAEAGREMPHGVFGERWLLLEHRAGDMPDLRAAALVAKEIRDTLSSGYRQIGLGDRVPEAVSGHRSGGAPALSPHIAIVPMSVTGSLYSDGHALGFAVVPPRDGGLFDDADFLRALRAVAPFDPKSGRHVLHLHRFGLHLAPTVDPPGDRRSLDPALYTAPATTFATVTPIVLDRHLKEKGAARQEEIARQIAAACRNAGFPEPETQAIVPDKHSAVTGAPSAYPSGNAPAWMRWKLPESLASRQLTHAVIRFPEKVCGPVLLGAGRFVGLGLCRPLDPEKTPPAEARP